MLSSFILGALLVAPPPNNDGLKAVYGIARDLVDDLQCDQVDPWTAVPLENLVAMRSLERAAGLYSVLALQSDNINWIPDFIDQAVETYERAYACAPGPEHLDLLRRALIFLVDVEAELLTRGAPAEPALGRLRVHRTRLEARVAADTPAAAPSPRPTPKPTPGPPPRRSILSNFSLQLLAGGGAANVYSDEHHFRLAGAALGLAAGARFRAGRTPKKRHAFGLGFVYHANIGGLERIAGERPFDPTLTYGLHRIGPFLRYGIFLVPTWLSLHAEAQFGLLAFSRLGGLADAYFAIGGQLCVWNEAFCVRGDYFRGTDFKAHHDTAGGWTLGLALDPLRLVDNHRERRARKEVQ